jgi:hypothetical protein
MGQHREKHERWRERQGRGAQDFDREREYYGRRESRAEGYGRQDFEYGRRQSQQGGYGSESRDWPGYGGEREAPVGREGGGWQEGTSRFERSREQWNQGEDSREPWGASEPQDYERRGRDYRQTGFGPFGYGREGYSQNRRGFGYQSQQGDVGTQSSYGYGREGQRSGRYGDDRDREEGGLMGGVRRMLGGHTGRGPKGYKRSDERIREDVCELLTLDPDVDATEIEIAVSEGEVTLTGFVSDRQAKRRAEDVAEQASGVKEVHNQLRSQQGRQHQQTQPEPGQQGRQSQHDEHARQSEERGRSARAH